MQVRFMDGNEEVTEPCQQKLQRIPFSQKLLVSVPTRKSFTLRAETHPIPFHVTPR